MRQRGSSNRGGQSGKSAIDGVSSSSRFRYQPVSGEDEKELKKKLLRDYKEKKARRLTRSRIHAVGWVAGAIFILAYGKDGTPFHEAMLFDPRAQNAYAYAGIAAFVTNSFVFLYLSMWLPLIEGNKDEWDVAAPWAAPLSTLVGLGGIVCTIIGLWPVYEWYAILFVSVLVMGMIMVHHFLPPYVHPLLRATLPSLGGWLVKPYDPLLEDEHSKYDRLD